jgi:hypothetical protein
MRHALVAIAISVAATAGAQPVKRPPAKPVPVTVAPPIVFPFPPLMAPPAGGLTQGFPFTPTDPTQPPRDLYRVRRLSPRQPRTTFPSVGGYFGIAEPPAPAPAVEPPAAATGFLRLPVTPAAAQVFVDAYYVGTVADIDAARALTLDAGPHRIEIRATGYQTLTVDVRIAPRETMTYRGALESTRPAAPERDVRAPAASSEPMYVIPNCYLGNVPPRPQRLPPGCDIKQVQVLGSK